MLRIIKKAGATTGQVILVVENDKAARELLHLHLENAGYRTFMTPDAVVAGKRLLADANDIALVIVDANLPYMSGVEFASTIIADSTLPPLPIILIGGGHDDTLDHAAFLDVPCVVKPFSVGELMTLVQATLPKTPDAFAGTKVTEQRLVVGARKAVAQ